MHTHIPGVVAAANYSAESNVGKAVYLSAAGAVTIQGTAGGRVDGILENNPAAGEAAIVRFAGIGKVRLGGTESAGALVGAEVTTADLVTVSTAGYYVLGYILQGGTDGQLVDCVFTHTRIPA